MFRKFPFYKQPDQMDCGPTCLRMVAAYHGKKVPLQELRELCDTGKLGSSLLNLKTASENIGFNAEAYRLSYGSLVKQKLPCIALWNEYHYVVIHKIKNHQVYIADPAHGLLQYELEDFLKSWSGENAEGIILSLQPSETFKRSPSGQAKEHSKGLAYMSGHLFKFKRLMTQLAIGLLIGSFLQLLFPFVTQSIVDNGIRHQDLNFIYLALLAQLLLFLGRISTDVIRSWILLHISSRVNILITGEFFSKLMKLPVSYFDRKMNGDILQRIDDNQRVEYFLTSWSLNMLFGIVTLIVFSVVLAMYSIPIFLAFVVGSSLYLAWVLIFMKKRADIDYKRFQQAASNQSKIYEIISGMQEIKLHNAEDRQKAEWEKLQVQRYEISLKSMKVEQLQNTGSSLINELKNIFITFLSAKLVMDGQISLGMMLSISYIIGQLNGPIMQLVMFTKALQDALLSLNRLTEIHDMQDEEQMNRHATAQVYPGSDLRIHDLSFHYPGTALQALDKISLHIPCNKITAIVGSSGSGKTTLLKLLTGFYPYQHGSITVGESELNHINTHDWRSRCGVVMQEGFLFSDTLARNITMGEAETDKKRLQMAADCANLGDVINQLPMGMETKIGNEGMGLSTGQKQRILIARAVYKNPDYLFFDEATSSLDSRNEKIITENLEAFFENRTVVIIAHRLSTVKNADQIIVMEKGQFVECGTHQTLIGRKGAYFHLVKTQLELANEH